MDTTRHFMLDDTVQLFTRPKSPYWYCATTVNGRQRKLSTKEESLTRAKDVARDWYLGLIGKYREGTLDVGGVKFKAAAARFMEEFEAITKGERSPVYVEGHKFRIKNHLNPFFGDMVLSEITAGKIQDYRIHRMKTGMSRLDQLRKVDPKEGKHKPPARNTLHQEIVCLRQILKCANRHGWLDRLPNLSAAFQAPSKISHRAWFSLEEYRTLYRATQRCAKNPPRRTSQWAYEQLHDFVLFMANTGLRPDEALRLQFRDVSIIDDDATKETILLIKVRGKRGVGFCKSMPNAVRPFVRLRDRKRSAPTQEDAKNMALPQQDELLFPSYQHELLNKVLEEEGLKSDREGQRRTAYSLRHTYICFRLLEGADIYQVAKNCRTSVEMIQKYYASHIETDLDAAAINVLKHRKVLLEEDSESDTENRAAKKQKSKSKSPSAAPKRFVKKQF